MTTVTPEYCPVARTLNLIGDRWSLLIIRDTFDGIRRFKDFQQNLGVARNILSDRLKKLTDAGVLEMKPASDGTAYQEYVLTDKGEHLFTVIVALRQWGKIICSGKMNRTLCWLTKPPADRFCRWLW